MRARHLLLATAVAAVWGLNFVVIEVGLRSLPPVLFVALRFAACALPAVFFVGRPRVAWRWIVAVAVTLAVLKFSLLFAGMAAGMPAGLSAVVLQSQAAFTAVFATVVLREAPGRRGWWGLSLAVVGLAVVGGRMTDSGPAVAGFALVLAAGAAWGLANVAMRKAAAPDALNFVVWVSVVATPLLFVVSMFVDGPDAVVAAVQTIDLVALGAIGYVAWLATLFGFAAWAMLIRRYGAATVAPFGMLAPVLAVIAGAVLLDEPVNAVDLIGGGLVLAGVVVSTATSPRPAVGPGPLEIVRQRDARATRAVVRYARDGAVHRSSGALERASSGRYPRDTNDE